MHQWSETWDINAPALSLCSRGVIRIIVSHCHYVSCNVSCHVSGHVMPCHSVTLQFLILSPGSVLKVFMSVMHPDSHTLNNNPGWAASQAGIAVQPVRQGRSLSLSLPWLRRKRSREFPMPTAAKAACHALNGESCLSSFKIFVSHYYGSIVR